MPTKDEQIQAALDSVLASAPKVPKVIETRFRLGIDDAGDDAIFVLVVLDEQTKDTEWTTANFQPIMDQIHEAIRAAGLTDWPYFRFARPSELNRVAG
ncbi:MAG: hypothetical protein KF912_03740 [Phycisphaeraceae bacterium]|nr:hypothetical protein [Phycisphaeraceae bacterium]MBX3366409.1 hypothetical protein [Phycisphaeraceae bacterium]